MYGVAQSKEERAMPTATTIARIDHEASQWDQAYYAFLRDVLCGAAFREPREPGPRGAIR
jgi:hypothetical protein